MNRTPRPAGAATPARACARAFSCAAALLLLSAAGTAPQAQPAAPTGGPAATVPDWSLQAQQRLLYGSTLGAAETLAQRQALLADAERQLAAGQTAQAQASLDQAAMLLHAGDTEAAQVRALMQAGDYRRALAFGAHAAGAHAREWPAGQALYTWLLQVGGQQRVAQRLLAEARERAPDDSTLQAAEQVWQQPWPLARGPLLQWPLRLAPVAVASPDGPPDTPSDAPIPPAAPSAAPQDGPPHALPRSAAVLGTAVLLDDGRAALLPLALLDTGPGRTGAGTPARLWLRNGLGQASRATVVLRDDALGVAVLRLASPLPAPDWQRAPRPPFGGSPGALTEYAVDDQGRPAWPLLRQGFFARIGTGPRPLAFDSPPGPRGGPVFDQAGRLAGIALPGPAGGSGHLLPVDALVPHHAALLPAVGAADNGPAARMAVDEVYELALRATLQLLVQR
jgi:hypothetical protein